MMKLLKRPICAVLVLVMLIGMLPQVTLPAGAEEIVSATNELEGKTISILGASISTYTGISNNTAYNSTIGSNAVYYTEGRYGVYANDTWWMQVANDLGLRLLVNNSWSGSSLLYERNGTVGAYVDRCVQLHDDMGDNAGEMPDIIGIQMGTNDFQYYKDTLGTADIDYDALITENQDGSYTYAIPATSLEAVAIVLHKISIRYPNAEVYYLNISQRVDGTDELIQSFNAELKEVVEHFGAHIVDIYGSAITMDDFDTYIGDGRVHPNCLGMDAYTEAFKKALLENTAYEVDTHTVSMNLDGVTADYGDDKIVVSGDSYTLNMTAAANMGLDVTVTMGGKDVTAAVYANGVVTIDSVTDDVTITAKAVHEPKNYRWEFDGTDLACVSGDNTLTKNAGTTTDGAFSKTRYALAKEVILLHELPWAVEWKCEGTFQNTGSSSGARVFTSDDVNANYNARYIFKSNTNGIIAMGEKTASGSHNYGIALGDYGIDWTALHTYRLENRISDDGSNMIYLFVDGVEIGPMNHYYIGTKDQNTTSDWLSGKDFVFPYMGTDTHGFTNASIEYILVTECVHTYVNGICTACGAEHPNLVNLEGKTISILGDSISTFAGVSNNTACNSTIGSNSVYYSAGTLGVQRKDTWWQQAIDALGMELLVNNSWSGSTVFFPRKGELSVGYGDRCVNLHNDTTGEEPDVIVVFLGTNDFSYYQSTLGTADIDYATLITDDGYGAPTSTCEAYAIMLHKMINRYPDAEIYCMGMTARRSPDKEDGYADVGQPTAFNNELRKVIEYFGVTYVDLENCGIDAKAEIFDTYMGDGRVHPNALGMDQITKALISAMLGWEVTLFGVSGEYTGVANGSTLASVISGASYNASLTLLEHYSDLRVTVTMGGEDITASCYANGTISIPVVTGDIIITATANRAPQSFKWKYQDGELVGDGETENALTKLAGTTTDGVFYSTQYKMEAPVILRHDLPWVMEWKGEGTGGFMLASSSSASAAPFFFRRAGNYLNAFGDHDGNQYNNYGIALDTTDIDGSANHVYRLENRIAADGSNMVWLLVDGVEVGSLTQYYVGGTSQGSTGDWISGEDFTFSYIGTSSHPLTNYAIEYLLVNECVHTYVNGICSACGAEHPNLANLEGKVISILGDSISTFAGYIPTADGFNLEHLARYPQDNLLTDVDETWWMQIINQLDAKLGINDSWRGATVSGAVPVTTGSTGENAAMGNLQRIKNLGANGTPDIILFYGGTNDLAHVSKIGTFDANNAPTTVDLTTTKWDNLADGYVHTLLRLKYYYPDALIIAMLPTYTNGYYSDEKLAQGNAVLAEICEHYGVAYVDLRECGISINDLPDNIHPDATGMDYITEAVLDALLKECDMEAGENIVHPVTHVLTHAESSMGYYKGVSHGKSFVATITGENLKVTVTMGGVDITGECYTDGKVVIPQVTGALVITAEGTYSLGGHLQQLPEDFCADSNLWLLLEHDAMYYSANGWITHSSGSVKSVTFPVTAGDRLYATSFGASGTNGGTINGIRVTYFDENGVLVSLTADQVYSEYSQNGYLTVPENAMAVSIPMWNNSDENEIYILNREHCYQIGICSACGAIDPEATVGTALSDFEYTLDAENQTVTLTRYIGTNTSVTVADLYVVDGVAYRPVLDSATLFRGNTTITSVTIGAGASYKDNSLSYLFAECTKLTNLDVSAADTTSVTDMSYLFLKCSALTSVELSGLDTGNVTTMRGMFSYCTKLASISGYENWNTGSLESMYQMFNRVASSTSTTLETIDLRAWDLDQVKNTGWCFQLCYAKAILLPDNLAVMSAGFFNHAVKVTGTTFIIPAGVKKIGYAHTIYDFATNDFVEFVVAEGNEHYVAIDGILYSADGREMLAIPRNKPFENGVYEIPEGVTFLGELSFSRNYNIETLILPDSYVIECIDLYDERYIVFEDRGNINVGTNLTIAIYCYTGITDYVVKETNPNYVSVDGILYSKDMTTVVAIPTRYGRMIEIPEGVTTWNQQAMWNDTEVADLYANNTVDKLLSACGGVQIPSTMVSIDEEQVELINRLKYKYADSFVITVHEDNAVYCVDSDGYLQRHSYENGICTHCGNLDASLLLQGDLDLDGDVDAEDLTLLARHVAGVEEITNAVALTNADVNGDNDVNSDDLTLLARYVAGIITAWEETP